MGELNVRKADPEDIPALLSVLNGAFEYKKSLDDPDWGDEPFSSDEVAGMFNSGAMYVAEMDSIPVGAYLLATEDERTWDTQPPVALYLHRLAVANGMHGKSIGSRLLDIAAQEVRNRNRQFLRLDCSVNNPGLSSYYERQGFKKVGERLIPAYKNYTANLYERAA